MIFKYIECIKDPLFFCGACNNSPESKNELKLKQNFKNNDVACSYALTSSKVYLILILWWKYIFDLYFTYMRQFRYLNSAVNVPEELKPYYSAAAFEEAKVHSMFRILMQLETKYYNTIRLTVVYITNLYCTLWWIAGRISSGYFSRVITFQVLQTLSHYKPGDVLRHLMVISSSCSVGQGACRICTWIRDIMIKCWSSIATFTFVEELLIAILLTLMTTPMCIVLFLLYRIYTNVLLPHIFEENVSNYIKLEEGELLKSIKQLLEKIDFNVETVYVSYENNTTVHGAKFRGVGNTRYLVLGWKLVDSYTRDDSKLPVMLQEQDMLKGDYTLGEIVAAVIRAHFEYTIAVPKHEMAIEATHWITTLIFAIFIAYGVLGGSRLGFNPSPPQTIAFTLSKHISIPVYTMGKVFKNCLCRKRNRNLDEMVVNKGFGVELISYIGKEARNTFRCPIEDNWYTFAYSFQDPPLNRIKHIKSKFQSLTSPPNKTPTDASPSKNGS